MSRESAVLFVGVLAVASTVFGAANLLENAGFEAVAEDGVTPAGWRTSAPSRLSATGEAAQGQRACRVDILEEPKWSDRISRASVTQGVSLKSGKYCYSGMVRGQNVSRVIVNFTVVRDGEREILSESRNLPGTFGWRRFTVLFSVPDGLDEPVRRVNLWFFGSRGQESFALLDDLALEPSTMTRNLIVNSGFEVTSIPGIPDYWRNGSRSLYDTSAYDARIDTTDFVGGKQSICLVFDTEKMHRGARANRLTSMYGSAERGKTYTVSAYMKSDAPGTKIYICMGSRGGGAQQRVELSDKWKRYSCTGVWVKKDAPSARTHVTFTVWSGYIGKPLHARIWIDNVQAEEGTVATDYCPAMEDANLCRARGGEPAPQKSASFDVPSLEVRRADVAPNLDGVLDDSCWRQLPTAKDFVAYQNGEPVKEQVTVKTLHDGQNLYLGFECASSGQPRSEAGTNDDSAIFGDDVFEFFFDPDCGDATYYHWAWNAEGCVYDEKITCDRRVLTVVGGTGRIHDRGWSGMAEAKTRVGNDAWVGEVRIPLFNFAGEFGDKADVRANFCRENPAVGEISCWSYTKGSFHAPLRFGRLSGIAPDISGYAAEFGRPRLTTDALADCARGSIPLLRPAPKVHRYRIIYEGKKASELASELVDDSIRFTVPGDIAAADGKVTVIAADAQGRDLLRQTFKTVLAPVMTFACSNLAFLEEKAVQCVADVHLSDAVARRLELVLVLTGNGQRKRQTIVPTPGRNVVSLKFGEIPDGYCKVDYSLNTPDGRTVCSGSRDIGIFPEIPHYVRVDPRSMTFVKNGAPIVPVVLGFAYKCGLAEVRKHGFNAVWYCPVHPWKRYEAEPAEYMAAAAENGLDLIINFGPLLRYSERTGLDEAGVKAKITEFMEAYREHPSILFYQVLDEPNVARGRKHPFSSAEELHDMHWFVKRADPYRPVFVNWGPNVTVWNDLSFTDIMAYDYYSTPVSPTERTIERHNYFDDHALRRAVQTGKPFFKWMEFDHGCTELGIRLMRPEEERCVTFLSLVNGVRAFSYFYSRPWNDSVWEEMADIGGELEELTPVICAPATDVGATSSEDAVRVLLKSYAQKYYLFVANSAAQQKRVRVRLSRDRFSALSKPLFRRRPRIAEREDRGHARFRNGALEIDIEGYGMRVFELAERHGGLLRVLGIR